MCVHGSVAKSVTAVVESFICYVDSPGSRGEVICGERVYMTQKNNSQAHGVLCWFGDYFFRKKNVGFS